jgi:hypothetical protein
MFCAAPLEGATQSIRGDAQPPLLHGAEFYARMVTERLIPVTVDGGRTVAAAEWGDPDGFPVLSLHGTPGSRLGRHPDEGAVRDLGIRLVT